MPRLKKPYQRILRAVILLLVFLFISIELIFRIYGLPVFGRVLVEDSLAHAGINCRFAWVKASLFSGLTFQGITATMDTPLGPICLSAREAVATFNPLKLCQGNFLPESFRLNAAQIQLFSGNGITLLDCRQLFFSARSLEKNKLSGNLMFSQNGIRIRGETVIDNYHLLPQQIAALLSEKTDSMTQQHAKIVTFLEGFQRRFEACEFGENDTLLTFSCQGDAKEWSSFQLTGNFDLNYGQIGPLLIHKQRGRFHYRNQQLQLSDLRWLLSSDEQIQASINIDFKGQSFAAEFQGRLTPETCMSLARPDSQPWPQEFSCPIPITFSGTLPPSKWDFSDAEPQMDCTLQSLSIMGTHFQQGSFSLQIKNGMLLLTNLVLGLDFRQQKGIRGNLQWNLRQKKLSANLDARFNLREVLHNHGLTSEMSAASLEDFDDVRLTINMEESPVDWRQWRIRGELREAGGAEFGLNFQKLLIPFRIESGCLHIEKATAEINQPGSPGITLDATIKLETLLKEHCLEPEFSLHMASIDATGLSGKEMLNARAKCRLDLKNRRFQLTDGEGILIPDLFLTGFQEQFHKIYEPLHLLLSGSQPARILFHIPEFELAQKEDWRVFLQIEAEHTQFRQLDIHRVKADGEISARRASFKNIRAIVNENEDFSLDLLIHFQPPAIAVKNAAVRARPELFEAFIFDEGACQIYRKIWENVHWDMQHLPEIRIPDLLYWEAPSNTHNWQLKIDATLEVKNASFKEFPIPGASIGLKLELPEALTLEPLTLKTQQGDVHARVAFSFTGIPNCTFSLDETQVPLDVILLLQSINENWKEFLDRITLHPEARLACKGFFDFANSPTIQINGTLLSPEITFRKAHLEKVVCNWNYDAARLFWNIPEAFFLGARLNNTGFYDFQTSSGESLLKIRNLPLDKAESFFLSNPERKRKNPLGGLIDSDCKVSMLKNWAESPLHLEGSGHFSLREADLWQVPLMDNLASILSLGSLQIFSRDKVSGLGDISRLDADFILQGKRLLINHFDTNGTIISLHGNGEYAWHDDQLDFTVKGEALKNVNLLSFMLKPLSWAFDAELTGSLKKPEWKIRSALNKMFETQ